MASFITNTEPGNADILNDLSRAAALAAKKKEREAQIATELKQGLETIDLKASQSRPGDPGASASPEAKIMAEAALAKWNDMVKRSKDYAMKQHQIKYQLPEGSPGLTLGKL